MLMSRYPGIAVRVVEGVAEAGLEVGFPISNATEPGSRRGQWRSGFNNARPGASGLTGSTKAHDEWIGSLFCSTFVGKMRLHRGTVDCFGFGIR